MFSLVSNRLRRRLSPPTSGSLRRRARQRQIAVKTRAEGERLAQERREQRTRDKLEQQRQAREELASYEPWGRAGGGAPNPHSVRYSDLRAGGIFPEDELKGVCQHECWRRRRSPRRRRRRAQGSVHGLRDDPQLCYATGLRNTVDDHIRYRQTPDQQKSYKQILDDMVDSRKKALKDETKQDLECERKLQAMDGPWGKPGPGGATWRDPRNVGLNFSKSMGWTDNEIFDKIKGDHKRHKRSSLTLPKVKKDDDVIEQERVKASSVDKLPDIHSKFSTSDEEKREQCIKDSKTKEAVVKVKKNKKEKIVKRLKNGERVERIVPDAGVEIDEEMLVGGKKRTPEETILRLTGGIELVPLLARQRRVGPRTLHSSDVTRTSEQSCQWREILNEGYLHELKNQMRIKSEQKEESRRDSAESCLRHHSTWASLWGRPGHGAPQRGRYARSNLAQLLYAPILPALPTLPTVPALTALTAAPVAI